MAAAVQYILAEGPQLGLSMNLSKCELVLPGDGPGEHDLRALFP